MLAALLLNLQVLLVQSGNGVNNKQNLDNVKKSMRSVLKAEKEAEKFSEITDQKAIQVRLTNAKKVLYQYSIFYEKANDTKRAWLRATSKHLAAQRQADKKREIYDEKMANLIELLTNSEFNLPNQLIVQLAQLKVSDTKTKIDVDMLVQKKIKKWEKKIDKMEKKADENSSKFYC